ncbi:hypothetical protein IE992_27465 [Klebsiella pneumoniae]|uniref:Uncharacterized protein n=1 Tax=Klebsiella pneumoniae TaxID=573 RepID=A0A927DY26_KLEPN|nr:hypothetical protein [Klebsiella pneumoniae]MBD3721667.1 hypothetical protein [Klebsiella pneumoniae]
MSIELGRMSVMAIARDNTTADINKDTNPILMERNLSVNLVCRCYLNNSIPLSLTKLSGKELV